MIRAICIDDEKNSLEMIEWLLKTYCPEVEIIAMTQLPEEGVNLIQQLHPDVVFLDIEMPRMNGFDVLEKLKEIKFEVIFTTAYDQFAVKAFRYAAFNYLLKPIDSEELMGTVARLKQKLSVPGTAQIELLLQSVLNKEKQIDRIALSTNDGLIFVQTKDISYCQAESNYTKVVLENQQKILVAKTLKEIDETLAGKDFFRVHHSYLVNVNHIQKFVRGEGGYIIMPDGTQITISRSKKDEFFQLFAKF